MSFIKNVTKNSNVHIDSVYDYYEHLSTDFSFTPKPLDIPTALGYRNKLKSNQTIATTPFGERKVYRYISQFYHDAREPNYIFEPRYSGLLSEYKTYYARMNKNTLTEEEIDDNIRNWTPEQWQDHISYGVFKTAQLLCERYEYLDECINSDDEDEIEEQFNNLGFTVWWRFSKGGQLDNFKYDHNEHSKWLHILFNMSDHDLKKIANPYVMKTFMTRMWKHPSNGFAYPIKLTGVGISGVPSRLQAHMTKRYNKARGFAMEVHFCGVDYPYTAFDQSLAKSRNIDDGYDLATAIDMYIFALKFNSLFQKYPSKGTNSQLIQYLGISDTRSVLKIVNRQIDKYIEAIDMALSTNLSQEQREYFERLRSSKTLMIDSAQNFIRYIGNTAEEIIQNQNARNVHGAMYMLGALERGSFNEVKEAPEPQQIKVTVDLGENDRLSP